MSASIQIAFPCERVVAVSIDRPHKRNACDFNAWQALGDAFESLAQRDDLRALILSGTGGHFCAGNDIGAAAARVSDDPGYLQQHAQVVGRCFEQLRRIPFPVIAAIEGACVGGGCALASYGDFRVATATASIGITALAQANTYPTALLMRLAAIIGQSAARRWLYGAALHSGYEATQDGFIDSVVDGDAFGAALEMVGTWLDKAPLALRAARLQFDVLAENQFDARRIEIDAALEAVRVSPERQQMVAAFLAKRRARPGER